MASLVGISATCLARYRTEQRPPGAQLAQPSACAVLALASGDAAFRDHVASRPSDSDRSRAKTRLAERGFPSLLPRLLGRATTRTFAVTVPERLVDLSTDELLVLAGPSAGAPLAGRCPTGQAAGHVLAEDLLVDVVEGSALERAADGAGDLVLRSEPNVWLFKPHARVAPGMVPR